MRPIDDAPLSPGQRRTEVARNLAGGVLRLHTRAALSPDATGHSATKKPVNSAAPGLEVPDETVLSVHNS